MIIITSTSYTITIPYLLKKSLDCCDNAFSCEVLVMKGYHDLEIETTGNRLKFTTLTVMYKVVKISNVYLTMGDSGGTELP